MRRNTPRAYTAVATKLAQPGRPGLYFAYAGRNQMVARWTGSEWLHPADGVALNVTRWLKPVIVRKVPIPSEGVFQILGA